MTLKRVGILTGGGDCSGLNAVIRAATRSAIIEHEAEVVGIENGFVGLIFNHLRMLSIADTKEILPLGSPILGTTNKGHPFEYREFDKEGRVTIQDYSKQIIEKFQQTET